jgi:lysophospholipase L1-like esterase
MHRIGTAFHYRFLVAMQPDVDRGKDYQSFREKAEQALRREGIRVLDLGACKEFVPTMFLDQMHLNADGNRIMADMIARAIEDEQLFAMHP